MAILSGHEGIAHIEIKNNPPGWSGYILFDIDTVDFGFFDIVGPQSRTVYEGPVYFNGEYRFAIGDVVIRKASQENNMYRVEFIGADSLKVSRTFTKKPDDYID